ncbi:MCE family protein [Pseudonocardia acaciae]|uniref:MCE family protein n=1 Tax=Pseudonocardia acaciae TaxID=551276 RepID=UPI0007E8C275|nr:MCE family protein [Pseudonocardia acaciae]
MRSLRGIGAPLTKFVVFAVAMLLCTAALAATIANQIPGSTSEYSAKFTDATGVNKGDEVRIAGVRVGEVSDIRLVDRKVALLEFTVSRDVVLPRSTEATIRYRNLIGQRYIALSQGVGPPGERLVAGATIPLEQTHPAVNLTQLFDGFKPLFRALSPQQVNQLSFELIQVLQGEGGTINSLLSHTASLTTAIADKDQVIGQVIDNLNQVLDTVNARDKEFTQLVITVRQLVSGLSQDRHTIGDAISSIGELTDATAGLLEDARPPLKADIEQLGRLAGNLNDNQPLVDRFLHTLPGKLDTLIPLGTYGSWFNFYLCDIGGQLAVPGGGNVRLEPHLNTAQRCYADNGGHDQNAGHDKKDEHHGGGR